MSTLIIWSKAAAPGTQSDSPSVPPLLPPPAGPASDAPFPQPSFNAEPPRPRPADREALRLTQQEFEGLPLVLLAQLVAAVAACTLGGLGVSGSFLPIRVADAPK